MRKQPDKKTILKDGQEYYGFSFGSDTDKIPEIVFNTSMAGYQEILSDPSCTDHAVVMTYPLIVNYGMTEDDYETGTPSIGALIVREHNDEPSDSRSTCTLGEVMERYGVAGVSGADTRKLNRSIRDFGSRKALLTSSSTPLAEGLRRFENYEMKKDAVSRVGCREPWTAAHLKSKWIPQILYRCPVPRKLFMKEKRHYDTPEYTLRRP